VRAGERHRDSLSRAGANHGLAGFLGRLQQVEAFPLALLQDADNPAAEDLFLAEPQELAGRGIREFDHAVRRGHEHRVRHAVQNAVEVALVDGVLAQARAHALESLLEIAQPIAPLHLQRTGVVPLSDAVGALDQGIDRRLQLPGRPPRDRSTEQPDQQCQAGGSQEGST
jgi:hypothetical protein